jgi:hypothetical protein
MKSLSSIIIAVFVAFMFSSCGIYNNISSDYDRTTDFTVYKTFAWLPDKADTVNSPYNNEIIRNNIRNYFGHCMATRGYKADMDAPDLLMQVVITNAKKESTVTSSSYSNYYYFSPYFYGSSFSSPYHNNYYYNGYNSYSYPSSSPTLTTQKIEWVEGAITLNLYDRKQNKLVWTGTAQGDIYNPDNITDELHPAVHNILDSYPVPPIEVDKKGNLKNKK